jgi:hypothetical protein
MPGADRVDQNKQQNEHHNSGDQTAMTRKQHAGARPARQA